MTLRPIYLLLAILGAALPAWRILPALIADGPARLLTDPLARGLGANLLIAGLALTVWAAAEAPFRRDYLSLLALPATLVFGVGCGLPLYLWLRSRP